MKKIGLVCMGVLACVTLTACNNSRHDSIKNSTSSEVVSSSSVSQAKTESNESTSSSKSTADETLDNLKPEQVASAVLVAGTDHSAWENLKESCLNGDGDLKVSLENGVGVTQPGTGMYYLLSLDGERAGMINGYTISQDGKTIYLYSEGEPGSAERTVAPFKTLSADKIIQIAQNNSDAKQIASNVYIEG
ncbi:hypothetical protein [Limosilactobacillus caccae]|uniref:hypothetical protein n=1 Tax=Limosilactobacillus caccae TaxID=1926284 RepID=UPI00097102CD|nr:hypothetical protein [Limosilactobacillus caccae]